MIFIVVHAKSSAWLLLRPEHPCSKEVEVRVVESTPVDQSLRETAPVGSRTFPLTIYYTDLERHAGGFVNWHWHQELQFCLVTKGRVEFFINRRRFLLEEGDGVFVNSEAIHMAKPDRRAGGGYVCLDFSAQLLSFFPSSVFEQRYVTPYVGEASFEGMPLMASVPWQRRVLEEMPAIAEACDRGDFGYEFEVAARVARMWVPVIEQAQEARASDASGGLQQAQTVRRIIDYLARHYAEKLTLEDIAEQVHKSPGECCRIFKRTTQSTIFEWLESYRVEQATTLLKSTSLPVSRIGEECGFASASYFSKVFKKLTGTTPLGYRRKC